MRVLFWSESFPPSIGGIEVLALTFASALRERGYDCLVVTRKDSDELPDESGRDGVPVHRFPFWTALAERNLDQVMQVRQRVAGLKRAFRPDLVHVNGVRPGFVFHRHTAGAHPAPTLVTLHGAGPDRVSRPGTLLESALRSATWVTACSTAALAEARQELSELTPYSSAIPNSLPLPALIPKPPPFARPRLLCLGRLAPEKGFDVALAAFARIVGRHPEARLVLAGDGPQRAELERQAAARGLTQRVEFVGWVAPPDVPALIEQCTLVVMPSRYEPFGLVALEAAQLARPIVATRVGGLPEVVVDGQTGLLVEPDDSPALAEALARLLDRPETARRMGQAARRHAEGVLSWERHLEAYTALYEKLVAGVLPARVG